MLHCVKQRSIRAIIKDVETHVSCSLNTLVYVKVLWKKTSATDIVYKKQTWSQAKLLTG